MDMSKFWSETVATGNTVPVAEFVKLHKKELVSLKDEYGTEGLQLGDGPLPAFGPGGPTSDEDDEFFPNDEDAESPSQTVSGVSGLMAYYPEVDELYVWNEEEGEWALWNY